MYWIASKHANKDFLKDIDKDGNVILTDNKKEAYHFDTFNAAFAHFNDGFMISQEY